MVFDVAGALDLVGRGGAAFELVENRAVRLAHHLRQNVEPAAVRHADDDLFDAERPATLDDLFECGDHRLRSVGTDPLVACWPRAAKKSTPRAAVGFLPWPRGERWTPPQPPPSAEPSPLRAGAAQSGRCHDGRGALVITSARAFFRLAKNARHSAS